MNILLQELRLRNFKGIKHLDIPLGHITNIYGENGLGKTSIFDAFCWLMFGKDSTGRKDFEIKTLDANNKTNPKTQCEVTGVFLIDGNETILRKTLAENWVKKQGSKDVEFKGNKTECYVNDVPKKVSEFDKVVSEILPEAQFKLITNPLAFNAMPWQDRRQVLTTIAGEISNKEVAGDDPELLLLIDKLSQKSLSDYKTELSSKKRKLKDSLEQIPNRIDEVNRSMPEPINEEEIKEQIAAIDKASSDIESSIEDANAAYNQQLAGQGEIRTKINDLRSSNQRVEFDIKNQFAQARNQRNGEVQNAKLELNTAKRNLEMASDSVRNHHAQIDRLTGQRSALREQWAKVNEEKFEFDPTTCVCPTCKRALETDQIDAQRTRLEENFNTDKQQRLDAIVARGTAYANEIADTEKRINEINLLALEADYTSKQSALDELTYKANEASVNEDAEVLKAIKNNPTIFTNNAEINRLEAELNASALKPADNTELKQRRANLQHQRNELVAKLAVTDQITNAKKRLAELQAQEEKQAQELADLEAQEFTIAEFTKRKIDMVEQRINSKFKYVSFKMYTTQINGGEVECCETLINGVPFSDANNAAKINAGLDIINALCAHYNAWAPIFIDNRESVNNLVDTASQIVNLIVSLDKALRIEQ